MIYLEKVLTALILPCGLLWLALLAVIFLAWRKRLRGLTTLLLAIWVAYSAAGNEWTGMFLCRWLGREFAHIDPIKQGHFDAIFVLGGGVDLLPNGQAQLNSAGDRVVLAARLYHASQTQILIAAGGPPNDSGTETIGVAHATQRIWQDLGIPKTHILRLPGRNTREEIAAIRKLHDERPEWKRVGLVTSAWHMPRAMRLAERASLHLHPLPADSRGLPPSRTLTAFIPSGYALRQNELAVKEMLAALAGQ